EHPMGAMHMDEIIDEADLPIKLTGLATQFRREIGGHGVDTKGFFRMHQFNKVEQFVFCRPEDSWTWHEKLRANGEAIYRALEIPYRVVNVCTGDIGTVAAKKYDIEGWFPRQNAYREVISCSNCTDYQARRLNTRAGKVGGDKFFPHTLNSSAMATSRGLVALGVLGVALILSSSHAAADGTSGLEGGNGQFQIYVTVRSSFDLAESGHPIPMEVIVTEVHGLPQANVPVFLSASVGTVSPDRVVTDGRGHASFAFFADVKEDTLVRITAQTGLDGAAQGIDAFSVRVVRLPPPPIYAQAG